MLSEILAITFGVFSFTFAVTMYLRVMSTDKALRAVWQEKTGEALSDDQMASLHRMARNSGGLN